MTDTDWNPGMTTAFDSVVGTLRLPVELLSGDVKEVIVMDGIVRGSGIVGRIRANDAMLGLKLDNAGQPVRVEVAISTDDATKDWWAKRVSEEDADLDQKLPRLIRVSGGRRGAHGGSVLLTRWPEDGRGTTRAVLEFTVPADEIDPAGLFIIEVAGQDLGLPGLLNAAPGIGLRIDSIRVHPAEADQVSPALISGGDTRKARTRGGWMTINPASTGQIVDLELVDSAPHLGAMANLGGGGRKAAQIVRRGSVKLRREARQAAGKSLMLQPSDVRIEAYDMSGQRADEAVSVVTGDATPADLRLQLGTHVDEPLLLKIEVSGAARRRAGFVGRTEWAVVALD